MERVTVVARSGEGMEEQRRKEQAEHRVTETGRYVLVQGHKIHSAQSEPECKLQLGVMRTCQGRFINCSQVRHSSGRC